MTQVPAGGETDYRERIRLLLAEAWGGNQRAMARDLTVSQGLISLVLSGGRSPGPRLLNALCRHPRINPEWVRTGVGRPLLAAPAGTLPVAFGILPGPPDRHAHLLSGGRHPVAHALDRPSRYWLALTALTLAVDPRFRLEPGDLLLVETDPERCRRPDLVHHRLCCVRHNGPTYAVGVVAVSDDGWRIHLPAGTVPGAQTPEVAPNPPGEAPGDRPPRRRRVRMLADEERKAAGRRVAAVNPPPEPGHPVVPDDVVGVCVYVGRPEPLIVP